MAVAQQEQQGAIAEQVIAPLGKEFGRVDACQRFVHAGIVRRGAFPVALEDMEASPHDPREAVLRLLGRQSRENLVRADGFIPRPRPLLGAKPLQCCCVDTRRAIPLLRLSKGGSKSEMSDGVVRPEADGFLGLGELPRLSAAASAASSWGVTGPMSASASR